MLQTPSKHSQLVAWLQEQQKPRRLREVMEKERHLEFIKQAQEKGYLLSPSCDFLLEQYTADVDEKCVDDILQVQLSNMSLKDVGEIGLCQNLRYCSLPGNFITNFETLKNCSYLVRLDLHENQISTLPGPKFWQSLPDLQILYIHNNSISRLSCLQNLGSSPNLQVLTLFDTPISLKKSYRHHVVNSIFSLKALDFHVISDEEIIEDANFGGHYSTMHKSFQFNSLLSLRKERDIDEEWETVRQILLEVSKIQAKHSPVLIIQRYIRGFLGRCQAKRLVARKIWATVAIQRFWRKYKKLEYKAEKSSVKKSLKPELIQKKPKPSSILCTLPPGSNITPSPGFKEDTDGIDSAVRSDLDYDTYMKNRRPGSISPGVGAITQPTKLKPLEAPEIPIVQHLVSSSPSPTSRHRANIIIDLTKLEAAAQLVPIDLSHSMTHHSGSTNQLIVPNSSSLSQPQDIEKDSSKLKVEVSQTVRKKHKFVTVHEMLGPLKYDKFHHGSSDYTNEEDPPIKFRISGLKSVLYRGDPTQELLIEKRETGRDIRTIHRDFIDNMPQPKPVIKRKKRPNANQRLFARIHGTMGMATLRAVQQAYKDREKTEEIVEKSDYILSLRDEREQRKERRQSYLEDKRLTVLQKRDEDMCDIAEALKQRAVLQEEELERRKEARNKKEDMVKSSNQDQLFATDFNGQNASISKALLRHDMHTIKGDILSRKDGVVKTERENQKSQAELVQRYLEHRKLMRQAQVAVERVALDSKLLQEANDKMIQTRNRVSQQRHKQKMVQAFYPLPKSATDPVLPAIAQEGKPNRFETLISMYDGRIGNHPTVSGLY